MQNRSRGNYRIAASEIVAEGTDLRVSPLTLDKGQCVPWRYHSDIADSFVRLEGPMVVETRAPRHAYRLEPGLAARFGRRPPTMSMAKQTAAASS